MKITLRTLWAVVLALTLGFAVQAQQQVNNFRVLTNLYVGNAITGVTLNGYNIDAIATNSAAGKLDATNGTAVNLTVDGGNLIRVPSFTASAYAIVSPVEYQVIQRSTSTNGSISITAKASGPTGTEVEARFAGGSWASIGETDEFGEVTGTLTAAVGFGDLDVRVVGDTTVVTTANVGVGDLFAILGQSNGSGRGTSSQSYTNSALAVLYGNDGVWKSLVDPSDSNLGQIDTVSSDSDAAGSVWPLVANYVMASRATIPIAFIPCAKGGTGFSGTPNWNPATPTDRTTLFGSAVQRMLEAGAKYAFWWQGENAGISSTNGQSYLNVFNPMANSMATNISGFRILPVAIEECVGPAANEQTNLWYAITRIVSENTNALQGPVLGSAPVSGGQNIVAENDGGGLPYLHIVTSTNLAAAAQRIATNILANFP